jgi:predicted secreted protein
MTPFTAFIIYFLIWWVVIFCTLPFGIRNDESAADGRMPGAPVRANLKRKLIATTTISAVVWVVVYLIITYGGISFHDVAARMAM